MAHQSVQLVTRLFVHSAWWKSSWEAFDLSQSDADDASGGIVAWSRVDVRCVGRSARVVFDFRTWHPKDIQQRGPILGQSLGDTVHVSNDLYHLGVFSSDRFWSRLATAKKHGWNVERRTFIGIGGLGNDAIDRGRRASHVHHVPKFIIGRSVAESSKADRSNRVVDYGDLHFHLAG